MDSYVNHDSQVQRCLVPAIQSSCQDPASDLRHRMVYETYLRRQVGADVPGYAPLSRSAFTIPN
eukprot:3113589-Rhodomonas_salina.5